jgi:hypothetical protein
MSTVKKEVSAGCAPRLGNAILGRRTAPGPEDSLQIAASGFRSKKAGNRGVDFRQLFRNQQNLRFSLHPAAAGFRLLFAFVAACWLSLLSAQFLSVGGNGQPGYSGAHPAFVQQTSSSTCAFSGSGSSGGTYQCVLPNTPSSGNILVFNGTALAGGTGSPYQTPSSAGASWSNVAWGSAQYDAEIWCAPLTGSPSGTVTITLHSGVGLVAVSGNVSEWSGTTCTVDGTPSSNSGTSTALLVGGITTTHAADLLLALLAYGGTSNPSSGPADSYLSLNTSTSSFGGGFEAISYFISSMTGFYFTSWGYSSSVNFQTAAVALKGL